MTNTYVKFENLKEANGKTIYENNMDIKHKIPIGTKVYWENETYTTAGPKIEKGIYTIFSHDRDCDGTPMYAIISESMNVVKGWEQMCPNTNIKELINRLGGFGYQCGIPECVLMEIPQLESTQYTHYMMEQFEKEYENYK